MASRISIKIISGTDPLPETMPCWLIVNWAIKNTFQCNFIRYNNKNCNENAFENIVLNVGHFVQAFIRQFRSGA